MINIINSNSIEDIYKKNINLKNKFSYDNYYLSEFYKKELVKKFLDNCFEELIRKACHPSRLLNWNEDILLDYPELLNL